MLAETEGIVLERHISLGCRPRSVWQRASSTLFSECENEDEKLSNKHFEHLPPIVLLLNCPAAVAFSERSLFYMPSSAIIFII